MINGIPKEVHIIIIIILKQCGMITKKWTGSKWKEYEKHRRAYIHEFIDNKCKLIES